MNATSVRQLLACSAGAAASSTAAVGQTMNERTSTAASDRAVSEQRDSAALGAVPGGNCHGRFTL
jgi:hypothetical protein